MTTRRTGLTLLGASMAIITSFVYAHPPGQGVGMMSGTATECPVMGGTMMSGSSMPMMPMMGMMMDQGAGPGMMPQMMNGTGAGMHRLMAVPDLSDEQRSALISRQRELQRELWRLDGKALDARYALQDVMGDHEPDPKSVGRALQSLQDVYRQRVEAAVAASNDARRILTEEQQQALDSGAGRPQGMGMRHMMGGG